MSRKFSIRNIHVISVIILIPPQAPKNPCPGSSPVSSLSSLFYPTGCKREGGLGPRRAGSVLCHGTPCSMWSSNAPRDVIGRASYWLHQPTLHTPPRGAFSKAQLPFSHTGQSPVSPPPTACSMCLHCSTWQHSGPYPTPFPTSPGKCTSSLSSQLESPCFLDRTTERGQ